ncbi:MULTISPECIES: cytochrome b [unclassified Pseudomonas]|uniref:cytochrome b n=1 Tax=unclassified Pseudomonas TaxID=196821 RepID=UPI0035C1A918
MINEKFNWQQMLLHWLSAVVIIWALVSGFAVSLLDVAPATFEQITQVNSIVGTVFVPVFLLRCYLRAVRPLPKDADAEGWQAVAAHFTHLGLYSLTAVVLLSGILMMERDIDLALFALEPLLKDHFWLDFWFDMHVFSCALLAALVMLHVAAVIKHELSGRAVLRRMWF